MQNGGSSASPRLWLGIGLLLAIGVLSTWATWRFFTLEVPGGNDFLANYSAWEAYILYGHSPYSEGAALHTQRAIYGRATLPGEDQNRMVYPFYSGLVHAPFVFLDYELARAIYMTLLEAAIVIGVVLTLRLVRWRPPGWLLVVLTAWALLFYPQARAIILGQFAPFGFLALVGALFLLKRGSDFAAGSLLVLSTMKPTMVFLIVPLLMLWGAVRRRWAFVGAFAGTLAVVVLGSLAVLPTWIGEWVGRVVRYSDYTVGQSPVWLLTHVAFPWMGDVGNYVLSGLLLVGLGWAWWRGLKTESSSLLWELGLTLVVSNLVVPRSATTNYVLMLIPTVWVLAALDREGKWGRLAAIAAMTVLLAGHWWLFAQTVVGNQEQAIMFIPVPVSLGLVLVLARAWLLRRDESRWTVA